MAQIITVPAKTFEEILLRLDELTRDIRSIKARIFEQKPSYGSKEWWEWSDRKALEDIKAGRGMKFDSAEEAIKWLNS